jgi:uncharacterized protein (TIGR03663 family)
VAITQHARQARESASQQGAREPVQERFRRALCHVTVGHLIWVGILILAMVTRLWDLGSRALHHDESLHTYYSWIFSEGLGYTHHPMMHGPFLFHFNALSYLLFGASDYTSRLTAALFGIVLVMLPWLLRGRAFLGPWGAIATALLILISPSLMYYSRFIRHDIFAIVGAMLLFIAVVRYLEKPASRWIVLAVASVGFVLTTHEITFVNLAILASFTGALIAWRVLPISLGIVAGAVTLFFVARMLLGFVGVGPVPDIPWQEPTTSQVIDYFISTVTHPVIVAAIAITIGSLLSIVWLLERRRPVGEGWIDGTVGREHPESVAGRFAIALHDRRAWGIGALVGGSIFVVLYTSMFSNMGGLGSGTFGAIGYWLGQHDVQRGEQPWFYYVVLAPQYEYLAILGSIATAVYLIIYIVRKRREGLEFDRRFLTLALTAWWALAMFLVLSWAGEKMPWLIVHFLLPMLILTGGGIGLVVEWLGRDHVTRSNIKLLKTFTTWGVPILLLLTCSFLLVNWASAGPFLEIDGQLQRTIRNDIPGSWWILLLPLLLAMLTLLFAAVRTGVKRALISAGAALGVLLLALQINAGWNLTYREGDVPRDMLIYVQTSPDVHQTVDDLTALSHEITGGMDLSVYYSGATQWPLNWYFRDFNQRVLFHDIHDIPDAPVIIAASHEIGEAEFERLENYRAIEMPLRWWIPEDETYRRFAIAPEVRSEWRQNLQTEDPPPYSIGDVVASVGRSVLSISEPEQQAQMFRLIVHRELTAPIGVFSMQVYIHEDYQRHFDGLRYAGSR